MEINWYPGHMAKAKRQLSEQLKRVDVVIELCDARLPRASRNPDLDKMLEHKQRVLVFGKSDLADPAQTDKWVKHYRDQGILCIAVNMNKQAKQVSQLIDKATEETVRRAAERGIKKTIRAMVVGVPNVGKSTFINRLHGAPIAKVGDMPGVTRANQWVKISPYLELLDTPGLLWPRLDDAMAARRLAYIAAIRDQVLNTDDLALQLLYDMIDSVPEKVKERYHVEDLSQRGEELLEAVCRGRGFLMRGGVCDWERACSVILDEFRGGKLGRITLEAFEKYARPVRKAEKRDEEYED
ncbi:MAG: ribosome biogenesis GTPase YlqF [Clostridia bacterium]|nr:ribosome biogenesis GTPase YlqF [Clostridia bacterium]